MKVAVLNWSGNVGKTTVAAHLLKPRMGDARVFSIESLNVDASKDGIDVEKLKGKQFRELTDELMLLDNAIIDVGASNIEDFTKHMQLFSGSHVEFDYFVVPITKEKKVLTDSVNTLRALSALGIQKERIRVVFNKVETDDAVEDVFAPIFGLAQAEKSFTVKREALIYQNEVFELLKSVGKTLGDVAADNTDYRAQIKDEKDEDKQAQLVRMVQIKRLATGATAQLDAVFKVLFAAK
jgi:MinD-like ATPase involved in chromosome partitioning or flagellar assembly